MNNSEEIKKQLSDAKHICRAAIDATGGEGWDFRAIATPSNNKQLRYSKANNEFFYQVLKTGRENVIVNRLDSGLNLFDNHPDSKDSNKVLGITRGYDFLPEGIEVKIEWGARADEALRSDVSRQILKTVSIEGEVHEYSIERKAGEIPIYYAELWEPDSLSLAPVPNDISAQVSVKRALDEQIKKAVEPKQKEVSLLNEIIQKF